MQSAWRDSFRRVNRVVATIITVLIGVILLTGVLTQNRGQFDFIMRLIEMLLPLAVGIQAALIFSPEDESPLEVMLACPRPSPYILCERLIALAVIYLSIALGLTLIQSQLPTDEGFVMLIGRWLAPGLLMLGLGAFVSVNSRRGTLGVLVVLLLWIATFAATIFSGDALLFLVPELYPIFPFAQPHVLSPEQYVINRLVLMVIGAGLIAAAYWRTRNVIHLLGL